MNYLNVITCISVVSVIPTRVRHRHVSDTGHTFDQTCRGATEYSTLNTFHTKYLNSSKFTNQNHKHTNLITVNLPKTLINYEALTHMDIGHDTDTSTPVII